MSQTDSAPKLLRLFRNGERVASIIVSDWQDRDGRAYFTIADTHPRASWFMEAAIGCEVSVLVLATEDVEWSIQKVHHARWSDFYDVELTSRRRRILESQPDDAYYIQLFGVET